MRAHAHGADLVDEFLRSLRVEEGASPLTVSAYRRDLRRLAAVLAGRRRNLATAPSEDLVAHLDAGHGGGLGRRTGARQIAAIRGLYRFAHATGAVAGDPAALLEHPRLPRRLPRALSPADARTLVEAAGSEGPRGLRDR